MTAPGWYLDPDGSGQQRYWTGAAWHPVVKHTMSRGAKIGLSVGAVVFVALIFLALTVGRGPTEYSPAEYRANVISTCQDAAKKGLRDPDSAKFDGWTAREVSTGADGDRQFSASGTVNAKNGFGGYTGGQSYTCDATVTKDGQITAQARS